MLNLFDFYDKHASVSAKLIEEVVSVADYKDETESAEEAFEWLIETLRDIANCAHQHALDECFDEFIEYRDWLVASEANNATA